jgi:hypothetical protein
MGAMALVVEEAGEEATSRPQKSPLTVVAGFAKGMGKRE